MGKDRKKKKNFQSKEVKKVGRKKDEDPSYERLIVLGIVVFAFIVLLTVVFVIR